MNEFLVAYRRYAEFEGRSDRKEFWYFVLFYVIVTAILSIVDDTFFGGMTYSASGAYWSAHSSGALASIFALASLIPSIAVTVRRLHDINKSGWFCLFWLIPIVGWIFLLIWQCQRGDPISNTYGETPVGSQQAEL